MAVEVLMPRQGQSVESCIIIGWKVKEGDRVKAGQPLCEVETDKAAFDVESPADGTVLGIFYPDDADVPVLKVIAAIGEPGEDISGLRPQRTEVREQKSEVSQPAEEKTAIAVPQPLTAGLRSPTPGAGASPRAKNLAAAKGMDLSGLAGSGPEGRVIERDVLAALEGRAPLSPAAKAKIAAIGSGIGGRILAADVQVPSAAPAVPVPSYSEETMGALKDIRVKGVRKLVAERMLASMQTTAQLTMDTSADARAILSARQTLKASEDKAGITINDMILHVVAQTAVQFADLNAWWLGEKMVQFENVHLGFAVDTPRGLMVPVIRFANRLSLEEISAEAKRLGKACAEGTVDPDALKGGTFTVTNLGAAGIESFTPVLNAPEVGILGICSVQLKPVLQSGGGVEFIPHMGLSLTFNHCATDGAPAARFLAAVREKLAGLEL